MAEIRDVYKRQVSDRRIVYDKGSERENDTI